MSKTHKYASLLKKKREKSVVLDTIFIRAQGMFRLSGLFNGRVTN